MGDDTMIILEILAYIVIFLITGLTLIFIGIMAIAAILITVVLEALVIVGIIKDRPKDII